MVGEHLLPKTPYLCTLRTPCMSRGNKAVTHCLKSYMESPCGLGLVWRLQEALLPGLI